MNWIRKQFRRFTKPFFWRLYKFYLSKSRWYDYEGLRVKVLPSVFHPGLLFSTKVLLQFALKLDLKGKKVLELGAGSGLISAMLSRDGALVLATDINPAAIESMSATREINQLDFEIIHSNLFEQIPKQIFDCIILNPPFFSKEPTTDREKAFFCGANFEYFHQLFANLSEYCSKHSEIYMILTDDCDITTIQQIVEENGFSWDLVYEEVIWGETQFIFRC